MITAIETNVLLDVLRPNPVFYEVSAAAIRQCAADGSLVICDVAYAELCVHFSSMQECDDFLAVNTIRVQSLHRQASWTAGLAWREYRQRGGPRSRILPDFLIGAHAQAQAGRLLTRDNGFYRSFFPRLRLFEALVSG
jgi:predicted nucleic acid-binding protein